MMNVVLCVLVACFGVGLIILFTHAAARMRDRRQYKIKLYVIFTDRIVDSLTFTCSEWGVEDDNLTLRDQDGSLIVIPLDSIVMVQEQSRELVLPRETNVDIIGT